MSKRYVSGEVDCPFYRSEDAQKLYCEGIGDGTALHLAFASQTEKRAYKDSYCCREFGDCRIADMLYSKYEEEANAEIREQENDRRQADI